MSTPLSTPPAPPKPGVTATLPPTGIARNATRRLTAATPQVPRAARRRSLPSFRRADADTPPRPVSPRRSRRAQVLVALTLLLCAVGGVGATPASAAVLVPNPIAKWILNHVGAGALAQYTCQGNITCYINGSYDPPRWGHGTVQTGGTYLRARSWTQTHASVVRTFSDGWKLTIFCQTTGEWVNGRWGWTNIWDYVGQEGETPRFVSDGFVNTGSNGFVAGSCTNTNYGGMWT